MIETRLAQDDLEALGPALKAAAKRGLERFGEFLVERVRENLKSGKPEFPQEKSGRLAASIEYRVDDDLRLIVVAKAPHAAPLELGDFPFMAPTLKECEGDAARFVREELRKALPE